jgi:hypothetical protein
MSTQFDLRNGAIRKKYDSLKYTLKKMENTLYELSLADAGFKRQHEKHEVGLHHALRGILTPECVKVLLEAGKQVKHLNACHVHGVSP